MYSSLSKERHENKDKHRYWLPDFLKGIAVIAMILFHIPYMSNIIINTKYKINSGLLLILARIAQFIFIFSIGLNITLSFHQNAICDNNRIIYYRKQLKRVIKIGLLALFITIITKFAFGPDIYVKFGIMHFAAVSIFLFMWTVDRPIFNFCAMILILILDVISKYQGPFKIIENISPHLEMITFANSYSYYSIDHFNLASWLPILIVGLLIGNLFFGYECKKPSKSTKNVHMRNMEIIGANSFLIYAIHFPIIYVIFRLLKTIS
ncbi:MAG: hypothetical protein CBD11_01055 [Phycisphaera sp. TMED151]|nr:MAG: hypothetical protein CBD11_01055 [Phycisphaera sp. TMED151]RPG10747.1 MAG: DUF1624 domain-containing protein [Phycisphaera sp. TMED24]|tara:strand:- start:212 stop:1006 length:795 start_codon:yes stop_codon:yes gene_type:complete